LLIVVSAYQLLFTWKVNQVESKAAAYAAMNVEDDDPERLRLMKNTYLDSISNETVFNLLVKKYTYNDCKKQQLNLGLDLQGGMSVVLQVNLKEFLLAVSDNNDDKYFLEALDKTEAEHGQTGGDFIGMFVGNFQDIHPDGREARLAPVFTSRDYQDRIPYEATNEEVIDVIREEAAEAIERTYNIISTRIDQFGVTQPNIQLESNRGRIIVELAGVDNPKRVRNLLQATANLELWLTYKVNELGNELNRANEVIAEYLELQEALDTTNAAAEDALAELEEAAAEDAEVTDEIPADDELADLFGETDTAAEDDLFGELDADTAISELDSEDWMKSFPLFSVLNPNIDENNQYTSSPVIGFAQVRDTAKVNEYLALDDVQEIFSDNLKFMWGNKARKVEYADGTTRSLIDLYAIKTSRNDDEAILDGSVITDARRDVNEYGENYVSMRMNSEGAKTWEKVTGDNVGNHIAIVVDHRIVSAPVIRSKIAGGNTSIEGGFTLEEAGDLASMLRIGKLPARAEIVEEEVVGPTLGKDNIRKGLLSLMWGMLLVVGFMIMYYSGAGMVADTVLLINIFLIIGVLASFSATLTLPGIAGLVLTVGMAVDANVIIFERIREELLKGKGLRQSIADGYKYSASAIIDANITTLLTAIILSAVGKGPVKGFAVILIIGIISSVFTAVLLARVIIESWLGHKRKERSIAFSTKFSEGRFKNLNIDFLGKRRIAYIVSGLLVLAGIASILTKGFELGVDFRGGREYKIAFDQTVNSSELKDALDLTLEGGTIVKTFGTADKVKVTTSYKINESGQEVDNQVEESLFAGLPDYLPEGTTFEQFKANYLLGRTKVDPIISVDFKRSAIWATVLSILAIFLYILIRFSNFNRGRVRAEYAVGAVVTIAHDVLIVLGVFSILNRLLPFSLEIDQAFIAALLTVIGYSLNDTVVVFDRIREYLGLHPKREKGEIINQAVNDTLSRTLITSLTTLFVVAILFVFGGSVIKGFAFALLIGIFIGTYSSVFVATPVMYEITRRREVKAVSKSGRLSKKDSSLKGKKKANV
jgi:SecD/SecF fusion protein